MSLSFNARDALAVALADPAATDELIAAINSGGGGGSSPLTTKGDLYGHSTADARVPVGTNGQVLTADSTQALGLKWAAAGGTGTVTSVDVSGGTTGLTTSGGPVTGAGSVTIAGTLAVASGGTGATTAAAARTNLGLDTMSTQAASAVAITGGAIDAAAIGANTPVAAQGYRPANAQTGTTYTLVLGDSGKLVTLSNAAAITLTVPANASVAFPVGAEVDLAQLGAGQVTVAAAGGVTLNSYQSKVALAGQYAGACLKKTATNTWLLVGNLA